MVLIMRSSSGAWADFTVLQLRSLPVSGTEPLSLAQLALPLGVQGTTLFVGSAFSGVVWFQVSSLSLDFSEVL